MIWWQGVDTETVTDRGSSNIVLAVTLFLIVAGCALSVITWWFWRNTHPDPEALAPLDVMSARRFRDQGPIEQRRLLDAARPTVTSFEPMESTVVSESPPPPVEEDVPGFEDVPYFEELPDLEDGPDDEHEPERSALPIDPLLGR